jgi:aspartate aminotransferase
MGLYGQRIGCLSFVAEDKEQATKIVSQLKILARSIWSNPPLHGAR